MGEKVNIGVFWFPKCVILKIVYKVFYYFMDYT